MNRMKSITGKSTMESIMMRNKRRAINKNRMIMSTMIMRMKNRRKMNRRKEKIKMKTTITMNIIMKNKKKAFLLKRVKKKCQKR